MSYEIKELGVTEILDQALKLIKDHFGILFGITASLVLPYYLLIEFLPVFLIDKIPVDLADFQVEEQILIENGPFGGAPAGAIPDASAAIAILAVTVIGGLILIPLANAAVIYAISNFYMGKTVTNGESIKFGLKKIFPIIWTSILMGIIVMLGFIALIIPGIFLWIRYLMSQHVVVLEGKSGFSALKRCKELMKGNYGKAFSVNFVMGLIVGGVNYGTMLIPQPHVQALTNAVSQSFIVLFYASAFVVFYFSARCQHENYDMQLLAESFSENEHVENDEYDDE